MKHIQLSKVDKSELLLRLNAKQRERFELALHTFDQVIAENLDNFKQHQNATLVKPPSYGKNDLVSSALFQRILDGEKPLPFPPPNSFGNPWYQLFDSKGPLPVVIGQSSRIANVLNPKIESEKTLAVNQYLWHIESTNDAAEKLLKFLSWSREHDTDSHNIDKTVSLLEANPEFTLSDPSYGLFKLYIGEHLTTLTKQDIGEFSQWYGRLTHGVVEYTILEKLENGQKKANLKSWLINKL